MPYCRWCLKYFEPSTTNHPMETALCDKCKKKWDRLQPPPCKHEFVYDKTVDGCRVFKCKCGAKFYQAIVHNFDWLKQLSVEEMAKWLGQISQDNDWIEWLQAERTEKGEDDGR